jgi:magnesium transporter
MRVLRWEGGKVTSGGRALVGAGGVTWIDCAPTPENLAFLAETFHFHPLALEDCAQEDQRVKLEQYADNQFTVIHRLAPTPDDTGLVSLEVDAFLMAATLVTVHSAPVAEIDRVFDRCAAEPDLLARGADFALYRVYDAITDVHFSLVDALATDIEELADAVIAQRAGEAQDDLLERIVYARRMHTLLRKRLAPQREVFAALARPGGGLVRDQTAIYFRDVVDHAVRLTDEIDTGRELLASAMDAYLSHTNNRLSAVMAQLTLFSAIFLPLNFVAGFFGMNLEILPAHVAVPLVVVSMIAMPAVMYLFFRQRRWL